MRRVIIWLSACCLTGGVACSQTPEGPLGAPSPVAQSRAPSASTSEPHQAATSRAVHRRHAAKTHATRPAARDQNAPAATPTAAATTAASRADDPLSFGMKWNGSNDNGVQTRTQNYNGNAEGTGAEVGLKLHF